MQSVVTLRLVQCFERLKSEGLVRSGRQFALQLDYLPQSWSEITKGRREATVELISKAISVFHISPYFLFHGEGEVLYEPSQQEESLRILTIITDTKGEERIVHVPVPAQAGYAEGLRDTQFMEQLPVFTLPDHRFKLGTHRSFDISGDSMEPVLFEGDRVICSFVEPDYWRQNIKDNQVYVVVTSSDIVVKRVLNRLHDKQILVMQSDNTFYPPYAVAAEDIKEVWHIKLKISPFLHAIPEYKDDIQAQLKRLQETLAAQSKLIAELGEKK